MKRLGDRIIGVIVVGIAALIVRGVANEMSTRSAAPKQASDQRVDRLGPAATPADRVRRVMYGGIHRAGLEHTLDSALRGVPRERGDLHVFALTARGLALMSAGDRFQQYLQISLLLGYLDEDACALFAAGGDDFSRTASALDGVMPGLLERFADLRAAALRVGLATASGALPVIDHSRADAAFRRAVSSLPADELRRFVAVQDSAARASSGGSCWAARTIYRLVMHAPNADDRDLMLLSMSVDDAQEAAELLEKSSASPPQPKAATLFKRLP